MSGFFLYYCKQVTAVDFQLYGWISHRIRSNPIQCNRIKSNQCNLFVGTFHEWTVENQSPGGAAKLSKTALDLMMFLVKIKKGNVHKTAALRTHAPHGFEGVEKMSYYGTYPVSKIDVGKCKHV